MYAAMGFVLLGAKNEFEVGVVNELSVLQPLKFCCSYDAKVLLTMHIFKGNTQCHTGNYIEGS